MTDTLNENAMLRRGLVVQDWSDENVQKIDDRMMMGFEVADEPAGTDTDLSRDNSGMGLVLPIGAHLASSDAPATPREQDVSGATTSIPSTAQAPTIPPEEPGDDGADAWTNEIK